MSEEDVGTRGKRPSRQFFSPEFRNRLDAIITFNALDIGIMEKIVDKFIRELNRQLAPKKVTLSITGEVRAWLRKGP